MDNLFGFGLCFIRMCILFHGMACKRLKYKRNKLKIRLEKQATNEQFEILLIRRFSENSNRWSDIPNMLNSLNASFRIWKYIWTGEFTTGIFTYMTHKIQKYSFRGITYARQKHWWSVNSIPVKQDIFPFITNYLDYSPDFLVYILITD